MCRNGDAPAVPCAVYGFAVQFGVRSVGIVDALETAGLSPAVESGPDAGNLEVIFEFRRQGTPVFDGWLELPNAVETDPLACRCDGAFRIVEIPESFRVKRLNGRHFF